MKLSLITLVAAAAGLASAQCPSSIPECAQQCLLIGAASVGCGETDYACQCTDEHQTQITTNATTCVLAACGDQIAINEVLPAAQALCSAINAGESCSSASGSSSSASSSSASGSASGSTSPTGSGSSSATATGGSSSSTASETATATDASGSGTATGAGASASSTAGAATMGSVGSLGVAVLGALVML